MRLTLKSVIGIAVFAVLAVVALYIFSSQGSQNNHAQAENDAQSQGVQIKAVEALPLPIRELTCGKYSNLPQDVVPCASAYDYVVQNYEGKLLWLGLVEKTLQGTLRQVENKETISNTTRMAWHAILEIEPYFVRERNITLSVRNVLIDAKDLSVIKEKT